MQEMKCSNCEGTGMDIKHTDNCDGWGDACDWACCEVQCEECQGKGVK